MTVLTNESGYIKVDNDFVKPIFIHKKDSKRTHGIYYVLYSFKITYIPEYAVFIANVIMLFAWVK